MCGLANANGLYVPQDTITVNSGDKLQLTETSETATKAYNTLIKDDYTYNANDANPGAIVKAGTGELVIDKDLTMNNPFVIDQGKVSIKNATVVSDRDNSANYTCGLSIADATLELDNAHFTSTISGYSFCVGNRDGGASKLILKNGSSVKTAHYVFAGYAGNGNTDYRAGLDATPATGDAVQRAEIQVLSGSELSAGSSLQFANVDVLVDGAGSVLRDNHRGQIKNQWPESYFAYGSNFETNIDVTGGGVLDLNWDVYTCKKDNSRAILNIKGAGVDGETGETVASSISVAGTAYLSMTEDYNYETSTNINTGSYTELNILEGGKAEISQLVMGVDAGEAKVTIDKDSTYTGVTMRVGTNGTLDNSGKLALVSGDTTVWPTDGNSNYSDCVTKYTASELSVEGGKVINSGSLSVDTINITAGSLTNTGTINGDIFVDGGTFTMADDAVAAGLTATSGTINLSGNVTFTGAVSLGGSVSESSLALLGGDTETLTVYIAKDTNIVLDDSILSVDGQQFVVGDNTEIIVDLGNVAYEEGTQLFTLSGSDGTLLTDTAAALEDKVTVIWEDEESGTRQEASGNEVRGSIATVVVPEPTTATLSLLALCGLCARRRRK